MNRSPFGFTAVFDIFKDGKLSKPIIFVKRIGQTGFIATALGLLVIQLNNGQIGGGWVFGIASAAIAYGFFLGILCFAIVCLLFRKNETTTTAQAIGNSFLKVSLYIFLPAIITTLILVAIFVLPCYR